MKVVAWKLGSLSLWPQEAGEHGRTGRGPAGPEGGALNPGPGERHARPHGQLRDPEGAGRDQDHAAAPLRAVVACAQRLHTAPREAAAHTPPGTARSRRPAQTRPAPRCPARPAGTRPRRTSRQPRAGPSRGHDERLRSTALSLHETEACLPLREASRLREPLHAERYGEERTAVGKMEHRDAKHAETGNGEDGDVSGEQSGERR